MTKLRRPLSMGKVFLIAFAIGLVLVLGAGAWSQYRDLKRPNQTRIAPTHLLAQGVNVSAQLPLEAIAPLVPRGYAAVIDLRPDGEAPDEPSSSEMAQAAHAAGLAFHYVPVPHGEIPASAVAALSAALADHQGPVLLYCRSGKRAARTWALAEAGRVGGMSADQIVAAVSNSGQDARDLRGRIDAAIAARTQPEGRQP